MEDRCDELVFEHSYQDPSSAFLDILELLMAVKCIEVEDQTEKKVLEKFNVGLDVQVRVHSYT